MDKNTTHRYGPNTFKLHRFIYYFNLQCLLNRFSVLCYVWILIKCLRYVIHNYRLPVPRPGQVLGLVGTNGIGKSTALKVLAGILKPNLGRFQVIYYYFFMSTCLELLFMHMHILFFLLIALYWFSFFDQNPPDWQEILAYFRGSELQSYFTRLLEDNLKVNLVFKFVILVLFVQIIGAN